MDLMIINQPRVFPYRRVYQIAKRAMDLTLCLLLFPLTLPLMGLCVLAIRISSPGPALFVQERIGKGGRLFRMYKLRTMHHNLDDSFHRTFMRAFVTGQIGNDESENGRNGSFPRAFKHAFVSRQSGSNGNGKQKIYKPIQKSQVTWVGRILRKTSMDELPQIINVLKGEMSLVGPRPTYPGKLRNTGPGITSGWKYCPASPAWLRCGGEAVSLLTT